MIYTTIIKYVEDIDVNDELDLDGDEYGDNDQALYGYAVVLGRKDFYRDGESQVTLTTTQGEFTMPAGHRIKVKIND